MINDAIQDNGDMMYVIVDSLLRIDLNGVAYMHVRIAIKLLCGVSFHERSLNNKF